MYRFLPGIKALKGVLESGAIGEICHIYSTHRFYLQDDGDVRVNRELGGGSLRDVGCYPVNLIGWLLNDYPQAVSAEKTMFQGVEHALVASLKYKSGVTANISCGFDGCSSMLTEINGTKGSKLTTCICQNGTVKLIGGSGNLPAINDAIVITGECLLK